MADNNYVYQEVSETEFLNNPLFTKDIIFHFYMKSYDDFILSNEGNNKPTIYIINLDYLDFEEFVQVLLNDLQIIYKIGNDYNWHYEKTNTLIFLNIHNIEDYDDETYKKFKLFIDYFNYKGLEYYNKFVIIDKTNKKIYNLSNIYIIHKKELLRFLHSNIFKPFIDYLESLAENNKGFTLEEHLTIQRNILFELIRLFIMEMARDKENQNFKMNVVEEFKSWLFKTDVEHKSVKNQAILLFNDLFILNDYKERVRTYNKSIGLFSNYQYYQNEISIVENGEEIKEKHNIIVKIY